MRLLKNFFPSATVRSLLLLSLLIAASLLLTHTAFAQSGVPYFDPTGKLLTPDSGGSIPSDDPLTLVFRFLSAFLQLLGLIALILIMYGGFTWLTSAGSSEKIQRGRDILIWAVIGSLVILASLGIVTYLDTLI